MSKYKYDFTLDTAGENTSHSALASRIKPNQRVLELGCSYGYLSKFLKEELACYVVGVDMNSEATELAAEFCDQVITADLDSSDWLSEIAREKFDWVLCADVLEHLKNPEQLLSGLKPFLNDEGCIAASVPNVAHASIRLELLQGHFDYESLGILDETHLHFYTRDGLISLFMTAGYICSDISYSTRDLADEAIEEGLANVGLKSSETLLNLLHSEDAVAYQFIIEARPAKQELVKNLPQPLKPKPLVTSGVFYSELKDIIASLEIHNKNHQEQIVKLEEKIELIEQQKENQLIDNTNLKKNIVALEEKVKSIEQQRDAQQVHNQSYKNEIDAWHETTSLLDTTLFNLTEHYQIEQENNKNLTQALSQTQERSVFLSSETKRLEGVLNHIHRKISYRLLHIVKNIPKKISGVFSLKREKETTEINSSQNLAEEINFHDYTAWLAVFGDLSDKKLDSFKADIASWQSQPKIAVLMPVYNPSRSCLENAIESVLRQVYGNFELCIADDASTEKHVGEVLQNYAQKDQRIKITYREKNGHISEASNTALLLVEADYVALMDHDDLLTADALYWVAKTINQNPDVQLIYSDEDKMDLDGKRYAPYFKPDWNPELLLSHNFICHLGVYKTEKVKAIGGFDSAFNGAQDFDLVLRYIADLNPDQIQHIPRILYHWRAVEGSTANGVHEKHYAETNIAKAVKCALQRQKRPAEIMAHFLLPGALRVRYELPEKLPLVSIVIPTRNGLTLLRRCIESIFNNTRYENYELIIVDNGSDDFITLRYLQHIEEDERVTIIRDNSPFNYAALNNKAVAQARGEIIALLNNDLEVINDDWLDEMVSHVVHSEVGAVGAKLYYPNDTVQHAGVIIGLGGVAGHSHKHFPRDNPGYCGRLLLTQNFSAVTAACMLVRKEVFNAVGGFDAKNLSVAFNDVDLCMRIGEEGYNIVWTPYAEMYHYESATRGYEDTPEKQARFTKEVNYMKQRWGEQLLKDRAYNPNLTTEREDFSFSWNKSE